MDSLGSNSQFLPVGTKLQRPSGSESPRSTTSSQRHRKRTSPEHSVSLRHGKYSSSAAEPFKSFAVPPKLRHGGRGSQASSPRRPGMENKRSHDSGLGHEGYGSINNPDLDKESAYKSNTSGSNDRSVPEDWFMNWNTNAGELNHTNLIDGDSPYYLPSERQKRKAKQKEQLNTGVNPRATIGREETHGSQLDALAQPSTQFFNPSFPTMLPTQDSESESGVYRSVIDDLTIKNKKLKKKLRKMERLHCNELNDEKLFEVRCYGLPPARKQELQELLQRFAADLAGGGGVYETKRSDAISTANATSSTNPISTDPSSSVNQSSASLLNNTDSAYATETTRMTSLDGGSSSLDASKAKSLAGRSTDRLQGTPFNAPLSNDLASIQFANERTKMRLVVRRLEQLFTGREALFSEMQKSEAQQKVAEQAAQEKRDAHAEYDKDSGDEDDRREASMMSMQQDDDLTKNRSEDPHHKRHMDTSHQRPTRPRDLDPNRAQDPVDNMEYLENMSFSSSQKYGHLRFPTAGDSTEWVYLNLINNLAQIHTLNVSLSFVKKAIRAYSDKLELSSDGHKVRWRGGLMGTKLSSDESGNSSGSGVENSSAGEASPDKLSSDDKTKSVSIVDARATDQKSVSPKDLNSRTSANSSPFSADPYGTANKFRYRPLMFHKVSPQKSSDDSSETDSSDDGSEADTNNSGGPPPILDSGSNLGVQDIGKFAPVDGAVIYFGGAPFCTDLSAQIVFREGGHTFLGQGEKKNYERMVEDPIGENYDSDESPSTVNHKSDKPLESMDWSTQDVDMETDDKDQELPQFTSIITPATNVPSTLPSPVTFNVSGLGGIRPDDNFVIHVKTKQVPVFSSGSRINKAKLIRHHISHSSLLPFFEESEPHNPSSPSFENEEVDVRQIRLRPSKLPEPTFVFNNDGLTDPLASTDEPRSYESHLSFAYNIEEDSRSSGEGLPSFHSPELDDDSPMDLDDDVGIQLDDNPLAPLSVVATAGDYSQDGSVASPKEMPIVPAMDEMDIGENFQRFQA